MPPRTLATVDEDFAEIDRLLRELRRRVACAAETVRLAAAEAARVRPKRKAVANE
jgi:hypothetical protein